MGDFINTLQAKWNIDILIVVIVLISGFFQQRYLCHVKWSKDEKYDAALKTLVVSLAASLIYILLQYKGADRQWAKYFISYFFATSLYELLVRPFVRFINSATGNSATEPPQPPTNNNQPTA